MSRLIRTAPLALSLALLAPSTALAHGTRHAVPTPRSSIVLCKQAQNGTLPASESAAASRIAADCVTLQAAESAAQATLKAQLAPLNTQAQAAVSTFRQAVADAQSQLKTALTQAKANKDAAAAKAARKAYNTAVSAAYKTLLSTMKPLDASARTDRQQYNAAIAAAKKAFWTDVDAALGITSPGFQS
jgi:hypothetical protein